MINKRLRIIASLLLAGMMFSAFAAVVYGTPNLQQQQQQAQQRAAGAREALEEARRRGDELTVQMLEIEVELQDVTEAHDAAYEQMIETIALLEETRIQLALAEERREIQYEAYRESLRFIYERGAVGYLEILFSSRSLGDIIRNVEYINQIINHDNRILDELLATERSIIEAETRLILLEAEHVLLESELRTTRESLEMLQLAKYQQYQRVQNDIDLQERLIREQEAESDRIGELIRQAEIELAAQRERDRQAAERARAPVTPAPTQADVNAQFLWPVPGRYRISSYFGRRPRPIGTGFENHGGIDIPAPSRTPIVAAEAGTVILSQWHGGFGNTVIISHGNGLTTLYAHNIQNLVRVGDQVARGQQIALVGTTGHSTGNHLHFEVRQDGTPVNPLPFLNR